MTDLINIITITTEKKARTGDFVVTKGMLAQWEIYAWAEDRQFLLTDVPYDIKSDALAEARHLRAVLVDQVLHKLAPAGMLRTLMSDLDITQTDIAETLGVSQGMVSMWLSGKREEMSRPMRILMLRTWGALLS